MMLRPCPICRNPVDLLTSPWRPFCSERCKTRDLGAWASEDYRLAQEPEAESGEGWTDEGPRAD